MTSSHVSAEIADTDGRSNTPERPQKIDDADTKKNTPNAHELKSIKKKAKERLRTHQKRTQLSKLGKTHAIARTLTSVKSATDTLNATDATDTTVAIHNTSLTVNEANQQMSKVEGLSVLIEELLKTQDWTHFVSKLREFSLATQLYLNFSFIEVRTILFDAIKPHVLPIYEKNCGIQLIKQLSKNVGGGYAGYREYYQPKLHKFLVIEFARYVVPRVLSMGKRCKEEVRLNIVNKIARDLVSLSTDEVSYEVVLNGLKYMSNGELIMVLNAMYELNNEVFGEMITNPCGMIVVEKVLELLLCKSEKMDGLMAQICNKTLGVLVETWLKTKDWLEFVSKFERIASVTHLYDFEFDRLKEMLFAVMQPHVLVLHENDYGVQIILEFITHIHCDKKEELERYLVNKYDKYVVKDGLGRTETSKKVRLRIVYGIARDFVSLSTNEASYSAVLDALELMTDDERGIVKKEMDGLNDEIYFKMKEDPFGLRVVEKVLEMVDLV